MELERGPVRIGPKTYIYRRNVVNASTRFFFDSMISMVRFYKLTTAYGFYVAGSETAGLLSVSVSNDSMYNGYIAQYDVEIPGSHTCRY